LKPAKQCAKAAATARAVLGQITRAFHFRDKCTFVKLYKTYVRPHLEFCTPAWSPWTQTDIDCIEKVQMKMVSMVSGLQVTHMKAGWQNWDWTLYVRDATFLTWY
jgi:hypothetical protein